MAKSVTKMKADKDTASDAPMMKLWMLTAKDRNHPQVFYRGAAHTLFVAAATAEDARSTAAAHYDGEHWRDEAMASCDEFAPVEPGVFAHLTTA